MIGTSFGSEAALLCGAISRKVTGLVAFAPADVVWAGYEGQRETSRWTFDGHPLPYCPSTGTGGCARNHRGSGLSMRCRFARTLVKPKRQPFLWSASLIWCWSRAATTRFGRVSTAPTAFARVVPFIISPPRSREAPMLAIGQYFPVNRWLPWEFLWLAAAQKTRTDC